MASIATKDRIVRTNDGELVSALLRISSEEAAQSIQEISLSFVGMSPIRVKRPDWKTNVDLQSFINRKSRIINKADLLSGDGQQLLQVSRDLANDGSTLYENVQISPGENKLPGQKGTILDPVQYAAFSEVVATTFRQSTSLDLGALLGPDVEQHFAAREEALNRLELLVTNSNEKIMKQRDALDAMHQERLKTLTQDYADKEAKLSEAHADRQKNLDERQDELDALRQSIDDRSSTHARREDRKQLLEAIKEDQRLALSHESNRRRYWVLLGYVTLLAFFLIPAAFLFVKETSSEVPDWLLVGQRIGFCLGFVITMGFFLRWLNSFAAKSAAEEFKAKQLQLDVSRASWLIELYFESRPDDDQSGLPPELLDRFSSSLFRSPDEKYESLTASDALTSAILGSAGKLKLQLPGTHVELEKKGIEALKSTEV